MSEFEKINNPELKSEARFWVDILKFLGSPIAEMYDKLESPIPENIRAKFDKWVVTYYQLEDKFTRGEQIELPFNAIENFKQQTQELLDLMSNTNKSHLTVQ